MKNNKSIETKFNYGYQILNNFNSKTKLFLRRKLE
jgi:hypothetical protein